MKNPRILLFLIVASLNFLSCNKKEVELSDPLVTNRDTLVNPADTFLIMPMAVGLKTIQFHQQNKAMEFSAPLPIRLTTKSSKFVKNQPKINRLKLEVTNKKSEIFMLLEWIQFLSIKPEFHL